MEGFSNQIKIERMVSNHFSNCNLEQLKSISTDCSQLLVTPTKQTTKALALKHFSDTILLLKAYRFVKSEQIDGTVSNHLSKYNLRIHSSLKKCIQILLKIVHKI